NPAHPTIQLMGVYSPTLLLPIARTLQEMGFQRAAVVHGAGLDEVALHGETQVAELRDGEIIQYSLTPADFGLKAASLDALRGGDAQENAQIITHLLQGQGTTAHKHAVAANVALLLRLFGHENLQHNAEQALSVLNSDQAYQKVQLLAARG
ncbi:MAG: anthranilate phosphoribosyltransferase, partial [Plesiomonas sp.]